MDENKPKKSFFYRLYSGLVFLLGVAIFLVSCLIVFHVQGIEVEGNEYISKEEVIQIIKKDPYAVNTVYVWGKYKLGKGEIPSSLKGLDIRFKRPWRLIVRVMEKKPIGGFFVETGYQYFDEKGDLVLEEQSPISGIPLFEGVALKKSKLYQKMEVDNERLFQKMQKAAKEAMELGVSPNRLVGQKNRIYFYIGNVCVDLGRSTSLEQIAQIAPILEKLGNQEGTLHLENYAKENQTITFRIGEYPQ